MSSMRIDGDKSAKVWAKRLRNLVESAEADGVAFIASIGATIDTEDAVLVYKEGSTVQVDFKVWSEE